MTERRRAALVVACSIALGLFSRKVRLGFFLWDKSLGDALRTPQRDALLGLQRHPPLHDRSPTSSGSSTSATASRCRAAGSSGLWTGSNTVVGYRALMMLCNSSTARRVRSSRSVTRAANAWSNVGQSDSFICVKCLPCVSHEPVGVRQ